MQVERLNFAVFAIKHFLSEECCASLVENARTNANWRELSYYTTSGRRVEDRRAQISSGFDGDWSHHERFESLAELVRDTWRISLSRFSRYGLTRYAQGDYLSTHQDTDFAVSARLVTFVLYLGGKYDGGDIVYPTLGLNVAPQRGQLLVFPSLLPHAVTKITRGERWVLVWFGLM